MKFSDFLGAVRSAWGWFNNAGILLAVLAGVGVNAVCTEVPTWSAVVACTVTYVAGFIVACYRSSNELADSSDGADDKDERISSLEEELANRPTQERVSGLEARLAGMIAEERGRARADAERDELRETFLHMIDPEQQEAVVDAWLSPGGRLDVSARPIRGLGEGIALKELLVPDGDGWARATDGAVSLLDSSGDLVALIMGRKLEAEESPAHGDLSRALREMDFHTKCTLVAVWEHGSADVTWIEPEDPDVYDDMFSEIDENFLRMTNGRLRDLESLKLVRHETVSGWDRRWTLEDGVADLLAENADALEAAREDAGLTWGRLTEIPGQGAPKEDA